MSVALVPPIVKFKVVFLFAVDANLSFEPHTTNETLQTSEQILMLVFGSTQKQQMLLRI